MKRVLHYVAIMNRAGQETFIMNLFEAMDRNSWLFDFLCCLPGKGDYDEQIHDMGGEVYHIEINKMQGKLKQIDNFWVLYRYLKSVNDKYSVFHIHTQHAMDGFRDALAAKMAGIPVVVHSHSTNTLYHAKAHKVFRKPLDLLPVKRLSCSKMAGEWLYGAGGKFEVIHNGIDVKKYQYEGVTRDRVRKAMGWDDKFVVGHVGSFTYPKNHEFLLEVFAEVHKVKANAILALAGKGELLHDIKEKAKRLEIEQYVHFLGTRDDVNELDMAFDVMLFPSRYEGLPVVLVEAQCTGLPCVVSDSITTEADISNNVVRISLNELPKEWAKRVVATAENMEAKRKYAYLAVETSGYSMASVSKRMTQIYEKK